MNESFTHLFFFSNRIFGECICGHCTNRRNCRECFKNEKKCIALNGGVVSPLQPKLLISRSLFSTRYSALHSSTANRKVVSTLPTQIPHKVSKFLIRKVFIILLHKPPTFLSLWANSLILTFSMKLCPAKLLYWSRLHRAEWLNIINIHMANRLISIKWRALHF